MVSTRHSKAQAPSKPPTRRSKTISPKTQEPKVGKRLVEQNSERKERQKRRAAAAEAPPPHQPAASTRKRSHNEAQITQAAVNPSDLGSENEDIDICTPPSKPMPPGLIAAKAPPTKGKLSSKSRDLQAVPALQDSEEIGNDSKTLNPSPISPQNGLEAVEGGIVNPSPNKKLRFDSTCGREDSMQPLSPSFSERYFYTAPSTRTSIDTEPIAVASPGPSLPLPVVGPSGSAPQNGKSPTKRPNFGLSTLFTSVSTANSVPYTALQASVPIQNPGLEPLRQQQQQLLHSPPAVPFGPSHLGPDLNPVQRAVLAHATSSGQDPAETWRSARKIAAYYTAKQLLTALEAGPGPPPSCAGPLPKPTAGVSYVVPSESKQKDVPGQEPLPHMVYRPPPPPGLSELSPSTPEVGAALQILLHSQTTVVTMPLRDENIMKSYLLEHASRAERVKTAGGQLQKVAGACDVAPLLRDKSFVCLHYRLETSSNSDGTAILRVVPCISTSGSSDSQVKEENNSEAEPGEITAPQAEALGQEAQKPNGAQHGCDFAEILATSNLQLGIMIRKGVGGTYPLRTAAKRLHGHGLLGVLMDEALPSSSHEHPSTNSDPNSPPNILESNNNEQSGANEGRSPCLDGNQQQQQQDEGPPPAHQRLSLYTLSCRLELYVEQQTWDKLDAHGRRVLQSTMLHLEAQLRGNLEHRNWEMLQEALHTRLIKATADAEKGELLNSPLAAKLLPLLALTEEEQSAPEEEEAIRQPIPEGTIAGTAWQGPDPGLIAKIAQQHPCSENGNKSSPLMDYSTALVLSAAWVASADPAANTTVHVPWPLYFINTRDSFTHNLIPVQTLIQGPEGRKFTKTEWFFRPGELPVDYHAVLHRCAATSAATAGKTTTSSSEVLAPGNDSAEVAKVLATMVRAVEAQCAVAEKIQLGIGLQSQTQCQVQPQGQQLLHNNPQPQAENKSNSSSNGGGSSSNSDPRAEKLLNFSKNAPAGLLPVGVTTFTEVFTSSQLKNIENECDSVDTSARQGRLPTACFHSTIGKAGALKRTKFFFGARYLWTREQLAAPDAHVAKGVRVDVPPPPSWIKAIVESPLVAASVLPPNHINSVALNMYHDGSEGIQVHFDDAARFQQPIYSLRLFSDSRLSFGTQLYGYTNGAFFIPMPRGCVTVMEAGSYAANGVKHCVRPVDMAGKSAGMILRRINPVALAEAKALLMEETIEWMQCLSLNASLRADSLLGTGESALGQPRTGGSGRPPGAKLQRQVASVMESMLRGVEYSLWKERSTTETVATTMARMLRRVELAEGAGVNLSDADGAAASEVMDNIVGYCDLMLNPKPKPPPRQFYPAGRGYQGHSRKLGPGSRTGGPLLGGGGCVNSTGNSIQTPASPVVEVAMVMHRMITSIEAAERAERADLEAVAHVLGGMVRSVTAVTAWENTGRTGPQPKYVYAPSVASGQGIFSLSSYHSPVQLLLLANAVGALLLCGGVPPGVALQDIQAAAHAVLVASKLGSMSALQAGLLTLARGGAAVSGPQARGAFGSLTPGQMQIAVGCIFRLLCQASGAVPTAVPTIQVVPGVVSDVQRPLLQPPQQAQQAAVVENTI